MRPYVAELSKICDTYVCVYPNAGLPNPMAETGFDETPADTSALLEEFARAGLVNMSGGCCGTTPDHIRAIADKVTALTPRVVPRFRSRPGCRAWSRSTSTRTRCSSTSASAPT